MRKIVLLLLLFSSTGVIGQKSDLSAITGILEAILVADQSPRKRLDSVATKYGYSSKEMADWVRNTHISDSINLSVVDTIINEYGWLGQPEISKRACDGLFLVIQHADLSSQRKYLPYLRTAVTNGKASAGDFAMLSDRIDLETGKFQVYGTQFRRSADGRIFLYPIVDEPNVNKRRREVGLDSMEVYAKMAHLQYTLPKQDRYKNKIVVYGTITDTAFKPLPGARVCLRSGSILTKADKNGEFEIVMDIQRASGGFAFKSYGYRDASLILDGDKDVYTFIYRLDKLVSQH